MSVVAPKILDFRRTVLNFYFLFLMARLFSNQPGCKGNFQMPAKSRRGAVDQCRLQSKELKGATISFSNFLAGDDGNGFKLRADLAHPPDFVTDYP